MGFYDDVAQDAHDALTEFGMAAVITQVAQGDYDPETGGFTQTATDFPVVAVLFSYPQRLIDGTAILQGDEQAYISPIGAPAIKPMDVMNIGGIVRTVINVKTLAPAGTVVLIEAQVRA